LAAKGLAIGFQMPTARDWAKADPNVAHFLTLMAGRNGMVEGPPGVAKSQSHFQLANNTGRELLLLLGSTMAPEDVGGIPHVYNAEQFFRQIPPYWAHRLEKPGVLVLADEFTCTTPSVRAPLQTMYADRRIGQCKIHDDNWLAAACNPPRWAPNASPLEKAMANRFVHFKWQEYFDGFCDGMESENDEFTTGWLPTLPIDWGRHKVKWGHLITGYLRKNSNERLMVPENDDEVAYPTYRSWHTLRDILAAASSVEAPSNIQSKLAAGAVGKTVGSNFLRHVAQLDLADPEGCLAGTTQFVFDRKRIDLASALLVSLVSCIKQNYTEERLDAAVDIFCNNVGKHCKDLVFTQLKHLVMARPEGTPLSAKSIKVIGEFGKTIPDSIRNKGKA
jgi:hypothetical protein